MMICVTDWVENIVRKGKNAGYQHFRLFPQCFHKASFLGSLKVGIVWENAVFKVSSVILRRKCQRN